MINFLSECHGCPCLIMPALGLIKQLINIVKIAVPIILIIMGIIDLSKAMMSPDDGAMKKSQGSFIKKIIAAVLVFLIPTILDLVLGIIATGTNNQVDTGNWADCWKYAEDCAGTCNTGIGGTSDSTNKKEYACYFCGNSQGGKYTWSTNVSGTCYVDSKASGVATEQECIALNNSLPQYDLKHTDGKCYNNVTGMRCPNGATTEYSHVFTNVGDYVCFYKNSYLAADAVTTNSYSMETASDKINGIDCSSYTNAKLQISLNEVGPTTSWYGICASKKEYYCSNGSVPKEIHNKYYCETSCN